MSTSDDDPHTGHGGTLLNLQISVARMEGMLMQALSDQGARLTKIEADNSGIHGRLSDKGKLLATHSERISANTQRIEDIERSQQSAVSKNTAIAAVVIAAAGLLISIATQIPWASGPL